MVRDDASDGIMTECGSVFSTLFTHTSTQTHTDVVLRRQKHQQASPDVYTLCTQTKRFFGDILDTH